MSSAETKYATYNHGGALRCCLEAIPTDENDRILAGEPGERRPCPHGCKEPDGGMQFVGGVWIAAWIKKETIDAN